MSFSDITKSLMRKMSGADEPLAPIERSQDQPLDEVKIVNYVKEKIDQTRQTNSRISLDGIYLTNVAYLLGFDGVYYDTTYRQFKNNDPRRPLTRNRFKINKILPTIQNRLARLTQSPPKYDVRPQSQDTDDKDAARLALEILNWKLDQLNFEQLRQDLHMAAMQGGVAYMQVHWNSEAGDQLLDPETGSFDGYQGDVEIEVLNCLEVFPDPLAKTLEDARWVIKAKVRKLDYFRERYDRGDAVKEEDSWLISSFYDLRANALTAVGVAGANTTSQMKNSAIELVYYEKRSKDHPNGRMIVVANGVLLEDKELPIGEFDLVKFDDIAIGGRYYAEAIITHLRPIQDQYNILRSKCADWIRKMLAGKYLSPKGAGLGQEAIDTESGEVVEYNPVPNAGPPQPLQIPQIPAYVYEDIKVLDDEFNLVSGIGDVSQGVSPGSSVPWRAMALLQEQDQTRLSVQTKRNEVGYAKVGGAILKYISKNYIMERVMKISGNDMEYAVKSFMGSDIEGETDCIVLPGSTVPNSKVIGRQDLLNTYQLGLMGDIMDPELRSQVLEEMEYGFTPDMWKEIALDNAIVDKTIEAIETNGAPPLSEWDNHKWILRKLNTYRKTDKYNKLSDEQKKTFEFVMQWHVQATVNIQHPELAQQQMLAENMVHTQNQMFGGQGASGPGGPGMGQPPPINPQAGGQPMGGMNG